MKTAAERMRERLGMERVMTSISLRVPERVIDDLKEIAPMLGFSGYQSLMKAYISQGLRKDLEKLEGSNVAALTESLRKRGVAEEDIAAAIKEAGIRVGHVSMLPTFEEQLRSAIRAKDRESIAKLIEEVPAGSWHVEPNRALAEYMSVKIEADHLTGGSGINTYDSISLLVIWADDQRVPLGSFSAEEIKLHNYIPLTHRKVRVSA